MSTDPHRPGDAAEHAHSGVSPPPIPNDDQQAPDGTGRTRTEITSPFEQGNSTVLTVTKYFDEDQPLLLCERRTNGRTRLVIEELPES